MAMNNASSAGLAPTNMSHRQESRVTAKHKPTTAIIKNPTLEAAPITPANFENAMKQSRWVSQAVMYGDRRPFPVAILTLDEEERPALAEELGIENDDNLPSNPKVTDLLQKVVDDVNSKFAQVEQVKKFRVLPHDLTIESGDLTPSLKVKRNIVHEKYADVYDSMYTS